VGQFVKLTHYGQNLAWRRNPRGFCFTEPVKAKQGAFWVQALSTQKRRGSAALQKDRGADRFVAAM
jgi:hypothetical protein